MMGFSPGDFVTHDGRLLHFEGGGRGIKLWDEKESKIIFEISDKEQALKAASHLTLLAEMFAEDRL
jgi:hypothetical protein